ncbi:MAG: hypothetical protein RL499_17 [Actinomycetota bacterium]
MSSKTAIQVPAGWYPDPIEVSRSGMATQRRWWDGAQWTDHVAPLPTPVSPDVSSATFAAVTAATGASVGSARTAPSPAIASSATVGLAPATVTPSDSARAAESMPLHSVAARPAQSPRPPIAQRTAAAPSPSAHDDAHAYEPFQNHRRAILHMHAPSAHRSRNPKHVRVHTTSVWLIATMPLTHALVAYWLLTTLPADIPLWTRALILGLPLVLTAALAGQDVRLMKTSGHSITLPWIIAVVAPPIYLAVRGAHVWRNTGATPWPIVVWISTQLAVIAVWLTLDPTPAQTLVGVLS